MVSGTCMPASATSRRSAGSINISHAIVRLTTPQPTTHNLSSLIYCRLRTRTGAGTGAGCRPPVAPTAALDATTARGTVRHQHTATGKRPHRAP